MKYALAASHVSGCFLQTLETPHWLPRYEIKVSCVLRGSFFRYRAANLTLECVFSCF